jgi:transposase
MTHLLNPEIAREISIRIDESSLSVDDRILIKAIIVQHLAIGQTLLEKNTTIKKLLKMLFGETTEKKDRVLPGILPKPATEVRDKPKGHGRKSASVYTGAKKVAVPHTLKAGDICPGCEKGKVYPVEGGVVVRITGNAPLEATSFECEKLRCNLCQEVFTAELPPEAGSQKYDAKAGAMIALLKYGTGLPFNRLEQLQESLGVPLPASTQWDITEKTAGPAHPVHKELIRQAAQGEIIHNDDTMMKILSSVNDKEGRKGTFTTGMLSVTEERTIALFFTGHNHAGENLTDLLKGRHPDRGPPIQMCDALTRNVPEFETILGNCMTHARRNFVDVAENFPEECRFVIELLGEVYKNDAATKEMTAPERLIYHQSESGPLMERLREWMGTQFDEKKVEPNSGLGKAFSYMFKHWEPLTLFLRVPGAPLDNNICEQALKRAILHRKNSLFYKTLHGAHIGDLFMSIIHTCRLSMINPFEYLVALQNYSHEVNKNPHKWLPWNYKDEVAAVLL